MQWGIKRVGGQKKVFVKNYRFVAPERKWIKKIVSTVEAMDNAIHPSEKRIALKV